MRLFNELAPFAVFAAIITCALFAYVWRDSCRRRVNCRLRAQTSSEDLREPTITPRTETSVRSDWKPQILRLHQLGVVAAEIAGALEVPLEEVELLIRLTTPPRAASSAGGGLKRGTTTAARIGLRRASAKRG